MTQLRERKRKIVEGKKRKKTWSTESVRDAEDDENRQNHIKYYIFEHRNNEMRRGEGRTRREFTKEARERTLE